MRPWKWKRIAFLLPLLLALAPHARAQVTPKMEIGAAFNVISHLFGDCKGLAGTAAFNVNSWFGVVGDLSGCKDGPSGSRYTALYYLAGPRVSYRRTFTPYAQVLFGGAHLNSRDASALTVGFGVEVKLNDRVGIRLIQPEYLRTRFSTGDREDLRVQTGIVFALGKKP